MVSLFACVRACLRVSEVVVLFHVGFRVVAIEWFWGKCNFGGVGRAAIC